MIATVKIKKEHLNDLQDSTDLRIYGSNDKWSAVGFSQVDDFRRERHRVNDGWRGGVNVSDGVEFRVVDGVDRKWVKDRSSIGIERRWRKGRQGERTGEAREKGRHERDDQ